MNHRNETNYYEILEVAPTASQSEIHRAYQRARETYSVDNPALYGMFSPDEARELLRLIDEAYSVLCNQALRKSYDQNMMSTAASVLREPSAAPSGGEAPQTLQAIPLAPTAEVHPSPATAPSESVISDDGEFVVRKRDTAKNTLPPGTARTSFGTYKIDEAFEADLVSCSDFDGAMLQKIRAYKNISIEKLSEATRISRTYLTAVEKNDYKNLPAAVFVRGFVVQMARLLGLDENKVAGSYMKFFKAGGGK
jgi:curved DNA-binding protein CbpA